LAQVLVAEGARGGRDDEAAAPGIGVAVGGEEGEEREPRSAHGDADVAEVGLGDGPLGPGPHPRRRRRGRQSAHRQAELREPCRVGLEGRRRDEEQRAVGLGSERAKVLLGADRAHERGRSFRCHVQRDALDWSQAELAEQGQREGRLGESNGGRRPGPGVGADELGAKLAPRDHGAAPAVDEGAQGRDVSRLGTGRVDPEEEIGILRNERGVVEVALLELRRRAQGAAQDPILRGCGQGDAWPPRLLEQVEVREDQRLEAGEDLGRDRADAGGSVRSVGDAQARPDALLDHGVHDERARAERREPDAREVGGERRIRGRIEDLDAHAPVPGALDRSQERGHSLRDAAQLAGHRRLGGDRVGEEQLRVEPGQALAQRRRDLRNGRAREVDSRLANAGQDASRGQEDGERERADESLAEEEPGRSAALARDRRAHVLRLVTAAVFQASKSAESPTK
jgi:hypothetical protein